MITGAHSILYTRDADADRAFLRDVLGFRSVDAGGGWLIFALPPAEVAVHPDAEGGRHELYLMCDDIEATVAELRGKGAEVGEVDDAGWGLLTTLTLPSDPYVVPTIHTYDPFEFTHQGATWVTPTPALGRTFGSAADHTGLNANLQKVRDYITRTGRVPFVGEYGAIDVAGVPLSERIKYYDTMTSAYASIGVQSCAWGYTNTFRLYDSPSAAWLPGILAAIRTTTTLQ